MQSQNVFQQSFIRDIFTNAVAKLLTPQTPQYGGRGPMGAQNYGINIFHCKVNTAIMCGRALL